MSQSPASPIERGLTSSLPGRNGLNHSIRLSLSITLIVDSPAVVVKFVKQRVISLLRFWKANFQVKVVTQMVCPLGDEPSSDRPWHQRTKPQFHS